MKQLLNRINNKYVYFIDTGEDKERGYYVTIGEMLIENKKIINRNVIFKTNDARELYNYLVMGEKKNEK